MAEIIQPATRSHPCLFVLDAMNIRDNITGWKVGHCTEFLRQGEKVLKVLGAFVLDRLQEVRLTTSLRGSGTSAAAP